MSGPNVDFIVSGKSLGVTLQDRLISLLGNKVVIRACAWNFAGIVTAGKELGFLGQDRSSHSDSRNRREGLRPLCPARAIPVDVAVFVGDGADGKHTTHSGSSSETEASKTLPELGTLGMGQPSGDSTGGGGIADVAVAAIKVAFADGFHESVMGSLPCQGDAILFGLERKALREPVITEEVSGDSASTPTLGE